MRFPRPLVAAASGAVLLASLPAARATAAEPLTPLPAAYVVAIDPGHGGSPSSDPSVQWDPGVVLGPEMEKDITLDVGFRLRALLEQEKVRVVLTRAGDQFLSIADRWQRVHASGARLFVSLHVNAFEGDPSISGSTIFYPKPQSLQFAQSLEAGLAASLGPFGIVDDGVAPLPDLWVHSDIPTATIEPAYMTNPREAALLLRGDFREAVARGVLAGIVAAAPQIEATRKAIVTAEAARAQAQRAAQLAAAKAAWRPDPVTGVALLAGGLLAALFLLRGAVGTRSRPRPRAAHRRAHRRRRTLPRRA